MAVGKYRFSLKSAEARGATQNNSLYLGCSLDADAILLAANLELAFSADVVSVDSELSTDYALPYPAGNDDTARFWIRDDVHGGFEQFYINNPAVSSYFDALKAAIPGSGLLVESTGYPATSAGFAKWTLGTSF